MSSPSSRWVGPVAMAVAFLGLVSCQAPAVDPVRTYADGTSEPDTIWLVHQLGPEDVELSPPPPGSAPVRVGLFTHLWSGWTADREQAIGEFRTLLDSASDILSQCGLHLALEVAQLVSLPRHLGTVQGNAPGSWGGHPPPGTDDPQLFNYNERARLMPEPRELFDYGKRYASPNAISIFVVPLVLYHTGPDSFYVSGLSYPPNDYHHPDDYPLRNSVLINNWMELRPSDSRVLAHEIGHMLLNTGLHVATSSNLMTEGATSSTPQLTEEQCERMNYVREWLFGEVAVPDPGPPTG